MSQTNSTTANAFRVLDEAELDRVNGGASITLHGDSSVTFSGFGHSVTYGPIASAVSAAVNAATAK